MEKRITVRLGNGQAGCSGDVTPHQGYAMGLAGLEWSGNPASHEGATRLAYQGNTLSHRISPSGPSSPVRSSRPDRVIRSLFGTYQGRPSGLRTGSIQIVLVSDVADQVIGFSSSLATEGRCDRSVNKPAGRKVPGLRALGHVSDGYVHELFFGDMCWDTYPVILVDQIESCQP